MTQPNACTRQIAGKDLKIETGKLAGQAAGAVTVSYGDTVVLVTVGVAGQAREGIDFLPLTVDYEERLYAAGKIPGGFIRREGRPTQEATLASRLCDRTIRPLLPKTWRREIQVIITVLSADQVNDPDILAIIGASAALGISEVPFEGPASAVTVGYIDGVLVLNPSMAQLDSSQLDLVVCSTKKDVVMVEAGAKEVSEDVIIEALKFGHEANQEIILLLEEFQSTCSRPKSEAPAPTVTPEVTAAITVNLGDRLAPAINQLAKSERIDAINNLKNDLVQSLKESFPAEQVAAAYEALVKKAVRSNILEKGQRIDGRGPKDIRPISCEVGFLPRTHGSALFNRGETQVMNITTLGALSEKQKLDGLGLVAEKRFLHHYNFPPFSSGEVKRVGTVGRREIGHGALAERAILPVIPDEKEFPYTIRLVSEVLSSSGSTSMASACASSLSLMDAGVPVKKAVAGIAMGLVTGEPGNFVILTDIQGVEDAYGDMDFKVAGTADGITALQMDIKLKGLSIEILDKAIRQSHDARAYILEVMNKTLSGPRPELSPYAPRMYTIKINPDKIGAVIGSGGKTIRSIIEQTKSTIDIEDDGTVVIGSADEPSARKAIEIIEGLTKEAEVGTIYTGKVTRILNFGAMVEILPGKEGLVHISELADYRVAKVEDVVKVGDEITVKVIDIDNMGRVNLSRKAVFAGASAEPAAGGPTPDYPFKSQRDSRPPRSNRPPHRDDRR